MIKNNDKSKPYSHPRWNDKQLPVVTGYKELSKEEKERVDRDFKEYCENHGIERMNGTSFIIAIHWVKRMETLV